MDQGSDLGRDAVADSGVADSAVADSAVADSAVADSAVADSAVADSAVADSSPADVAALPDSSPADVATLPDSAPDSMSWDVGAPDASPKVCSCLDADTNGDGQLTPLDTLLIVNCIGLGSCPQEYDVNGDGIIDSSDALCVNDFLNVPGSCDPAPCASNASTLGGDRISRLMARCNGTAMVSQCAAELGYCNVASGWRLCSATEYRQHGGVTTPAPAGQEAWIKGCVLDRGVGPYLPKNKTCDCTYLGGNWGGALSWECIGGSAVSFAGIASAGLSASKSCRYVGSKHSSTRAYWAPLGARKELSGAMCCRP